MRRTRTKKPRLGFPGSFSLIKNAKRDRIAHGLPFAHMKRVILSTRYELSLAFVSTPAMKRLNRAHRGHDRSTDILSFSIAPDMGELIVSSADVAKRAPAFGMAPRAYLAYLFIHGCLHLMGHDHGPRMDREEQRRCKQLNTPHPSQKRVIG